MAKKQTNKGSTELAGKLPVTERSAPGSQDVSSNCKVPLNPFERGSLIFACALLFVVVGCVFLPALRSDFVQWDDDINIYGNPHLGNLSWTQLKWAFTDMTYAWRYQPLSWVTWSAIHTFSGFNPYFYHLIVLLFHAANSALIFLLIRGLLAVSNSPKSGANTWPALTCAALAAALWALHPLRVETVAWAVELIFAQSAFFFLLSVLAYLRESRRHKLDPENRFCWAAWIWFVMSLLSYPLAMGGLVVFIALDFYPLRRLNGNWRDWRRAPARNIWLEKLPFLLVGLATAGASLYARTHASGIWAKPTTLEEFGLLDRIMQAFFVWAYYLWKPWWPLNLSPVYTTLVSFSPVARPFLLSAALVIGLTVLLAWKRRQWPALLALWVCYLALLVPMLGLTEHPHYPSDRYSYIPAMLWSVLLAAGLFKLRCKPKVFATTAAVSLALIALLAGMSVRQTRPWRDSVSLFECVLARLGNDPYRADIYCRLGRAYADQNRLDEAISQFQEAIRSRPDYADAHYNLGTAFFKKGQMDEAIIQFQESIRLKPDDAAAHDNLGTALDRKGQIDGAITQFQEAIRLNPANAMAHNNLGVVLVNKGQLDEAIRQYQEAIRLKPDYTEARNNLGIALGRKGKAGEAIGQHHEALRLTPDDAAAHNNLGIDLGRKGQIDEAIIQFQEAIRLKPDYAEAHNNLGIALGTKGKTDEAIIQFQEAIRLNPDDAVARKNLGIALGRKGQTNEARR